jgi:hypothetical protein
MKFQGQLCSAKDRDAATKRRNFIVRIELVANLWGRE